MIDRQIDSNEYKSTSKGYYVKILNSISDVYDFTKKKFLNLADLIEIDKLPGAENAFENRLIEIGNAIVNTDPEILLAENIDSFLAVTVIGEKANSTNKPAIGILLESGNTGESKKYKLQGFVENPSWSFTPNAPIYLNDSTLSHTPPATGILQKIGTAKTDKIIYVNPEDYIQL